MRRECLLDELAGAQQRAEAMDAGSERLTRLHRHVEHRRARDRGQVARDRLGAVDELHRPR